MLMIVAYLWLHVCCNVMYALLGIDMCIGLLPHALQGCLMQPITAVTWFSLAAVAISREAVGS